MMNPMSGSRSTMETSMSHTEAGAITRRALLMKLGLAAGTACVAPALVGVEVAEAAPNRPSRPSRPNRPALNRR